VSPRVSVCIPVYNGEPHVAEAVRSVLQSTYDDFELVVVDQQSTDRTVELVSAFEDDRIRLVHNTETKGVVANWNRAIEECRGELVKMVCADDAIAPTCIEKQVAALDEHPSAVMAACRRSVVDENGKVVFEGRGLGGMKGLVRGDDAISRCIRTGTNAFGEPPAVMVRADVWKRTLPWSGKFPFLVDLEMWFRILRHGDLVAQPEALALFRVHGGSASTGMGAEQGRQARALFREVREASPVKRHDAAIGALNAEALRWGRVVLYRLLAARSSR
jgi:glycosyltransferase involved in cell wall biosynthesis